MNILFFLTPKEKVSHIFNDDTLRQVVEKMEFHGYSAIPLLDKEGKYIGTITEGDLLWYLKDHDFPDIYQLEDIPITDIERKRRYLDELFFCLNDSGQNLLTEMAKAICMLDNYRIQVLSLSGFLTYEKTIADKLSPPSPLSDDKK